MGAHHSPHGVRELAEDMSVKVAVHEDGQVVLVLGEGEDEEAWIISPYLAENLGEELFRAAREGRANIAAKRGRQDGNNDDG